MARLARALSVVSTGTLSTLETAETGGLASQLTALIATLVVPTADIAKAQFRDAILNYLPALDSRLDILAKRLGTVGDVRASILYRQQAAQISVQTANSAAAANGVFEKTTAFARSLPEQKQSWADYLTGGSVADLTVSMESTKKLFNDIVYDATRSSQDYTQLSEFYSNYAAHLLKIHNNLSRERQALLSFRNTLTTCLLLLP